MGRPVGDLAALVRCRRLAVGLPAAFALACRMLGPLTDAYDDVVAPIVERTITDRGERARADCALRAMSVKIGLVMLGYARMTGCDLSPDVAALAGAVTRLYDDLIDGCTDTSLDDRLVELFSNRTFCGHSDLERLLGELVTEIRQRVDRQRADSVDVAVSMLHEYQCLSRRQRDDTVSLADLDKICRGKGAMANLTLCSLVKARMTDDERDVIMALGETLQALDDYMDVEMDKHNGISTFATLGVTTLADIGLRMCVLCSRLAACYGRSAARPYSGVIFFLLLKSAVGRKLPIAGRITLRLASHSRAMVVMARGTEALPSSPGSGEDV
jgi:hypothetical protein